MNKIFLFGIFFLLNAFIVVNGQKYINDSVIIHIEQNPAVNNKHFQIYNIIDKRNQDELILDISEVKKYLVVPVDYYYMFEKPFDQLLDSVFITDTLASELKKYILQVEYFQPGLRNGGFVPQFYLNACVTVFELNTTGSREELGKLVYEITLPYKKADKKASIAYPDLIFLWQDELIRDINNLQLTPKLSWFTYLTVPVFLIKFSPFSGAEKNISASAANQFNP